MSSDLFGFDAFAPREIARQVETIGVAKARLPLLTMSLLAVLAGAFIGLGALFFTLVSSDPTLGFALTQVLGGVVFSLGLILVVVAGAELFTGNNLLAMAWAGRRITTGELLRNWAVVALGNLAGAVGLAALVVLSGQGSLNGGAVGETYMQIAAAKVELPFWTAFFRGVLCNVLVCMAVWMAIAGRSVTDKVVAIVFPISAFVAAGFEHSVANMYFIPVAMFLQWSGAVAEGWPLITIGGFIGNLVPVILGNLAGGSLLVGLVYWLIYLRGNRDETRAGAGD
ncbi:MAG TPA: formate/nitrite transporter family protein [Steroidobacteraceae bacterium]|nr:formate/nitrite transporter family protein [Steroidobacteraceae bacterium]